MGGAVASHDRDRRAVVLLTGFEPFGRWRVNSSWEAVASLDGGMVAGARVVARRLPVSFARVGRVLDRALEEARPRVVVAFGMHGGPGILLERVAVNLDDTAKLADNDGRRRRDAPISPRGPAAHFSGLPLRAIEASLRHARLPVRLSTSAGTYLCNHAFYRLMESAARARRPLVAGFVHLPPLRAPGLARRGLPLAKLRRAVEILVASVVAPSRS